MNIDPIEALSLALIQQRQPLKRMKPETLDDRADQSAVLDTAKHTPGPWRNVGGTIVSDTRYVAKVDDWSNPNCAEQYRDINNTLKDESDANARLIASAPELLAAVKELLDRAEAEGDTSGLPEYDQARAAIAKARTKQAQ